jgi:hypothetical protein
LLESFLQFGNYVYHSSFVFLPCWTLYVSAFRSIGENWFDITSAHVLVQEFCNWLTVYEVLSDPVIFQAWFCFGIPRSLRLPVLCSWHSQSPSLSCQLFQFTHWSKLGKILNDLLIRRLVDHCFDWIAAAVLRQVYFEAINWFGLTCQHFLFIFAFLSTVASLWRGECHIAYTWSCTLPPCSCEYYWMLMCFLLQDLQAHDHTPFCQISQFCQQCPTSWLFHKTPRRFLWRFHFVITLGSEKEMTKQRFGCCTCSIDADRQRSDLSRVRLTYGGDA